jgi:hypothetical protein
VSAFAQEFGLELGDTVEVSVDLPLPYTVR